MRKKIVVVTGSSGTIGTRLCEYLFTQKQFHIIPVDWKKNPWNNEINQRTVRVDLRNSAATFKKLPKQADQVIHLASNARVYDLVKEPKLACDNMLTTFNVLEYARHRAQGVGASRLGRGASQIPEEVGAPSRSRRVRYRERAGWSGLRR